MKQIDSIFKPLPGCLFLIAKHIYVLIYSYENIYRKSTRLVLFQTLEIEYSKQKWTLLNDLYPSVALTENIKKCVHLCDGENKAR